MALPDLHRQWLAVVVENIRSRSTATFEHWFSGVQIESLENGFLSLRARDDFVRGWVQEHFAPAILAELERVSGQSFRLKWSENTDIEDPVVIASQTNKPVVPRTIHILTEQETMTSEPPQASTNTPHVVSKARPAEQVASALGQQIEMNDLYSFEHFVVGPSNHLAFAASVAAAGGTGRRYNPLFLYGSTGLGKTHLLQAIVQEVRKSRPDTKIVYSSADSFTNAYIRALQDKRMDEFRAAYHRCDVLLLDDIQSLGGRPQTQEELFNTFNALHSRGTQIVLAADKNPRELNRMEQRLVSRFTWGLVADIQPPELETRIAIIRKKAVLEHISLPDEVASFLAGICVSNVRELEGCLIRLTAKAFVLNRDIDLEFAQEELRGAVSRHASLSAEKIKRLVAEKMHVQMEAIEGKGRRRAVVQARHIAMYLCRMRLNASYPEIGRIFGDRDHSTVMSAVKKIEKMTSNDPTFRALVEQIERTLTTRH